MNGETAQAIALVANGNAVLAGDVEARAALAIERLPFPPLSLAFVRAGVTIATTPAAWVDDLRARGGRRLALMHLASRRDWLPEHDAVAFAGGRGVLIADDVRPAPELWAGEWRVDPARVNRAEPSVWHMVYHAAEPPVPLRADEPAAARWELDHAADVLRVALEAAARAEGPTSHWTRGFFAPALARLRAAEVLVPVRRLELLPRRGYGATARRLLAAADLASSVFGGMSSWSDSGRSAESDAAAGALHEAAERALRAAVNAFGVDG